MGFGNLITNKEKVVRWKKNNKKNGLLFVYLPSCCSYRHVTTTILCRFEKYPHLLANLLQLLFTICNACRPFVATTYYLKRLWTFCGCYLLFTTPTNLLWLLPIVYSTCKPFVVIAYCLQHHYLPYKPQILGLPLCCYPPV
jgi:hypothetical protein